MKLDNKVALITGGNSGIGLATARLFVAEGGSTEHLPWDGHTEMADFARPACSEGNELFSH